MSNFIVSPLSISFESIKANLEAFLKNKTEGTTWKDFYASAGGQTVLEIAAAMGAFYAFQFISGRREAYLSTAKGYKSIVGLAQNNGYSCGKGRNLRVRITNMVVGELPDDLEAVTLKKWTPVGQYGDLTLVLAKDTYIESGKICRDFEFIIGDFLYEEIKINSDDLKMFNFYSNDVTEDYRLLLGPEGDQREVPVKSMIKDLLDDSWVAITNTYGGLDVFYLNNNIYETTSARTGLTQPKWGKDQLIIDDGTIEWKQVMDQGSKRWSPDTLYFKNDIIRVTIDEEQNGTIVQATYYYKCNKCYKVGNYKYKAEDLLTLQYIKRNTVTSGNFTLSSVLIDVASQITSYEIVEEVEPIEEKEQIKLKAPLYHETSMKIRSRKDYSKYLLLANDDLLDANDRDIHPGLIELTYVKSDGTAMTPLEKTKWLDAIEETRPSGVAKAIISEPIRVSKELGIDIWLSGPTSIDFNQTLNAILDSYERKLGVELDLHQIEHDIEDLEGVKVVRVNLPTTDWEPSTNFAYYDMIQTENDDIYYVDNFLFYSGDTNPFEQLVDFGEEIIDGDLVWKRIDSVDLLGLHQWQANTAYSLYDYVRKDVLSPGTFATSGDEEPEWRDQESKVMKDTVIDGNITWQRITNAPETTDEWYPNRLYFLDDIVQVIKFEEDQEGFIHKVSYFYKCASCLKYEEITIYQVTDYIGRTGIEEPTWDKLMVYDGNILWSKITAVDDYGVWSADTPIRLGQIIKITDSLFYIAASITNKTGSTEPEWDEDEIVDGNITWKKFNSNRKLKLDWNKYLDLSKSYTMKG